MLMNWALSSVATGNDGSSGLSIIYSSAATFLSLLSYYQLTRLKNKYNPAIRRPAGDGRTPARRLNRQDNGVVQMRKTIKPAQLLGICEILSILIWTLV
jgi:hypothetical protein